MTQIDARNAVNRIKLTIICLMGSDMHEEEFDQSMDSLLNDVIDLERSLSVRHFLPAPNCRKATPEELRQLCASSNVVFLSPAA